MSLKINGAVAILAASLLSACGAGELCGCGGGDAADAGPVNLGVAAADFSHDGRMDVAVTGMNLNGGAYVAVYPAGANGVYGQAVNYPLAESDDSILAVDLNGDGLPDLIGFNSLADTGKIPIYLNDPAHPGTFTAGPTLTAGGTVGQVAVGDLDGDGLADIVVSAGDQIDVFMQNRQSPGTFSSPIVVSTASYGAVAIGDVNGDGIPDIILSTASGLVVLIQNGTGNFEAESLGTIADAGTRYIYVADVDGDGRNDLIVNGPLSSSGASATLWVLRQDPQNPGHFLAPASYPTLGDAFNVAVVPLGAGAAGLPDLIVGASEGVSVLLQDPAKPGVFLAAVNYTQYDATGLTLADANGDGLPDVILPGPDARPAVMLQDPTHPGAFLAMKDL